MHIISKAVGVAFQSCHFHSELMSLSHAHLIYRAAIAAVSPLSLVARAVNFDPHSCILNIGDHNYTLNKNVRVVGFGKAVLGMAAAVEQSLGNHITTGLVSVPKGILETAVTSFPHYLLQSGSKIRISEGGEHNQPDAAAYSAAKEILSLVREASEEDIVMVLMSGGGSALLPCPVEGVSLQEKAQAINLLSNTGATINELNSFRKVISQTKGGKLAEAAYPAKVIALILSDVIDDPLDTIASGPTVPNTVTKLEVLQLLDKYSLKHKIPASILSHLQAGETRPHPHEGERPHPQRPIKDGCYLHTQNVIIGNNRTATQAALSAAESLGYSFHVWSHRIQGEARDIGTVYARIAHSLLTSRENYASLLQEEPLKTLLSSSTSPAMRDDLTALHKQLPQLHSSRPLCLISAGEPTVTVKEGSTGVGGRSQELALTFAIALGRLSSSLMSNATSPSQCVLACVGTDGQDGPGCSAAGAVVDMDVARLAQEAGLSPSGFLENNDSHTFFSQLGSGRYLIHTGLTGTNVMDIHILLVT